MNWYNKCTDLTPSEKVFEEIRQKIRQLEKQDSIDVSIVMIAYNEEKRILPAIYSLANIITPLSVEIIVVNNNSTDRTQEIIDKCGVKSVFQPIQGAGNARQAGLEIARGKYHFCADSDTLYPPHYVDIMVKALRKPGAIAAYCPCSFLPDGNKSAFSLFIYEYFRNIALRLRFYKRPELSVGAASLAFYTEPAREVGWRTNIHRGEDGCMVLALKPKGKTVLVTSRKARPKTTSRTLDADGGLLRMICLRLKREFARIKEYFTTQQEYKDEDSNLIK